MVVKFINNLDKKLRIQFLIFKMDFEITLIQLTRVAYITY